MSQIIDATYKFLDELDKSSLIKELTKYKNNLMQDKKLLKEIQDLKKEKDQTKIINKRKEIYQNNNYKMYMQYYNELSFIILKINNKYKEYTKTHNCHN